MNRQQKPAGSYQGGVPSGATTMIEMPGCTNKPAHAFMASSRGVPNLLSTIMQQLRVDVKAVTIVEHNAGLRVRSRMNTFTLTNLAREQVEVHGIFAAPLIEATPVFPIDVRFGPSLPVAQIPAHIVRTFKQTGLPNTKVISQMIQTVLQVPQNLFTVVKQVAQEIEVSNTYYDNSAFYAKLIFYALQLELLDSFNIKHVEAQFNAAHNMFRWINTTVPAEFTFPALSDALYIGDFIVFNNWNFLPDDIAIWKMLGHEGVFINSAALHPVLPCSAYRWPAIGITALMPSPMPNVPTNPITSTHLWSFIRRWSSHRNEQDFMMNGYYLACEMVYASGISIADCLAPAAEATPVEEPMTPLQPVAPQGFKKAINTQRCFVTDAWCQTQRSAIPAPRDINFMLRIMGALHQSEHSSSDYLLLHSLEPRQRQHASVVYHALIEVVSSTVLYSHSITAREMHQWLSRSNLPDLAQEVMDGGLLVPPIFVGDRASASLFELTMSLIGETCHSVPPTFQLYNRTFNNGAGMDANITPEMSPWLPHGRTVRRRVPWLCIDAFLRLRPIDWGVAQPGSLVQVQGSIHVSPGARFPTGAYSYMGNNIFGSLQGTYRPNHLLPWGPCFVNALLQGWFPNAWPRNVWYIKLYDVHRLSDWTRPVHRPWDEFEEFNEMGIVEPGSVLTFSFSENAITAPVLLSRDANQHDQIFQNIRLYGNQYRYNIGYSSGQYKAFHVYPVDGNTTSLQSYASLGSQARVPHNFAEVMQNWSGRRAAPSGQIDRTAGLKSATGKPPHSDLTKKPKLETQSKPQLDAKRRKFEAFKKKKTEAAKKSGPPKPANKPKTTQQEKRPEENF